MKPAELGSSSLALMERNDGENSTDAIQTGPRWRGRDANPHCGQAKGLSSSRNGVSTGGSPWDVWEMVPLAKQLC